MGRGKGNEEAAGKQWGRGSEGVQKGNSTNFFSLTETQQAYCSASEQRANLSRWYIFCFGAFVVFYTVNDDEVYIHPIQCHQ